MFVHVLCMLLYNITIAAGMMGDVAGALPTAHPAFQTYLWTGDHNKMATGFRLDNDIQD